MCNHKFHVRQTHAHLELNVLTLLFFQKDGLSVFELEDPDIVCLQETKCSDAKLPDEAKSVKGYKSYFLSGKFTVLWFCFARSQRR